MKSVVLLLCVTLFATISAAAGIPAISSSNDGKNTRIVGGVTARRDELPHVCAIELIRPGWETILGAGNVVSRRWILTVANNIYANNIFQRTEVICGRFDLAVAGEPTEQRVRITAFHKHPNFRLNTDSAYDIGLLHLISELHYTANVQAINLPVAGTTPTGIASLVGWGGSEEAFIGQRLGLLHMTRVGILPTATCNNFLAQYSLQTNTTHMCTGPSTGGLSPCKEDQGASLFQVVGDDSVIVGMVSLPQACGAPGAVGTYTKVSDFVPWINGFIL